MEQRPNRPKSRKPVVFRDGLGRRCRTLDSSGSELEVLCLRPELSTATHEAALRERVARLANVRTGSFARVRAVQRLNDAASTLALVSAATPGIRLSEILTTSERLGVPLDGSASWAIVVQLTSAVALMQENAPDVAHGAIAPERIVVTPDARVVVVEHVLGGMIESDGWTPDRFWKEQRIATPANVESFDLRSDVTQIGVVALSLVLGRGLRDEEYPGHLARLVESATITAVTGGREPMSMGLRSWLDRALQLDERRSFSSAIEASAELHRILEESESIVVPLSLEAFLSRLQTAVERDRLGAAAEAAATMTSIGHRVAEPPAMEATPAAESTTVVDEPMMEHAGTEAAAVAEPVAASTGSVVNPAFSFMGAAADPPRDTTPDPFTSFSQQAAAARTTALGSFWKERPWSRQAAAAAVLTVVVGAGWLASRSMFEVRAEPSHPPATSTVAHSEAPVPTPEPEPPPPSTPALPEVELKRTSAPVAAPATTPAAAPATPPPAPVATGWVNVTASQDLTVSAGGAFLGTSRGGRIRLPAGVHQLEFVNEAIGYRTTRMVQVRNNAGASVSVELPNGTLSLNATPWAEVLVDGKSVGDTPIGNLSVSLGSHDVVFRHPELGEKRMTATVTTAGPTRLSADLRK